MCHEYWSRRRRDEAEESRRIWEDFDRTRPIADPDPPEVTEPEPAEAREEVAADR